MKKNYFLLLLTMVMMAVGGGKAWAAGYTRTLTENLEISGYKVNTLYNFQNNNPEVLPTSGDLRYRDGGVWGLHNFGSGTRSGTASITVTQGQLLVLQHYSSSVISTISCGTLNETLTASTGYQCYDITSDASSVTFTIGRYGGIVAALLMDVDATAEIGSYTINYKYNNEILKSDEGTGVVGTEIKASNPLIIDGVKYFAVDGETTSITLASGTNQLDVNLRMANSYNYTVNIVDGNNEVLKKIAVGTSFEGDEVTTYYSEYILAGTTLYNIPNTNNAYKVTFVPDADNYVKNIAVGENSINDVVFYTEAEDITGVNVANNLDRASMGHMGYTADETTYKTVTTIAPAKYIIYLRGVNGNSAARTANFKIGDEVVFTANIPNGIWTYTNSDEFWVYEESTLEFACTGSSASGVDWFYIVKTEDAQTTGYTINYQYEGETLQTETGDAVVGAEVNAQESITVTTGEGDEATTQTYYVAENQTTSMTIDADAANNVLNVALRLPLTGNVVINAVDGEGNILKSFTAEATEGGDKVNVYYTRAVEVEGVYYTVPAKNGTGDNYAIKKAYGEEPSEVVYIMDEEIAYYAESEDMPKTRSFAAEGAVPERASGGHWYRPYANSYLYTPELEGGVYTVYVSGRNSGSSDASLGVQVRYSNGTLVGEESLTWGSAINAEFSVENLTVPAGGASIAIVNGPYNSNVAVDYVILYKTGDAQTELITITSAGAATYCSEKALNFEGSEVKAYYLTVDGDEINQSEAMVVPANTGIYLEGAEGTYEIPIASANDIADNTADDNVLQGVIEETQVDAPIYVLMNESNVVGFYKTKNTFTVGAHTAYIPGFVVPTGVKSLNFAGSDDPTTGIRGISNDAAAVKDAVIYNLAGQRVTAPTKGIYIVNGKKVMVK